jgi:hypothetical protein
MPMHIDARISSRVKSLSGWGCLKPRAVPKRLEFTVARDGARVSCVLHAGGMQTWAEVEADLKQAAIH